MAKVYRLLNFSPPLVNHWDSSFHDTVIFNFVLFFRLITCHVANKNPLQLLVYMSVAQDKLLLFKSFLPSLINYALGAKLELSEYFRSQIYNWFAPTFSAVLINIIATRCVYNLLLFFLNLSCAASSPSWKRFFYLN